MDLAPQEKRQRPLLPERLYHQSQAGSPGKISDSHGCPEIGEKDLRARTLRPDRASAGRQPEVWLLRQGNLKHHAAPV